MNTDGDLYYTTEDVEAAEQRGDGLVQLTRDQARGLSRVNRRFRRIVASEIRAGRSFDLAWEVAMAKLPKR